MNDRHVFGNDSYQLKNDNQLQTNYYIRTKLSRVSGWNFRKQELDHG
jgi:hypothetical protein